MSKQYWYPTKPYTVEQLINQRIAATGSPQMAELKEHANYNGHFVWLCFNEKRQYWISEYTWAGRCVIERGDFEEVLNSSIRFHSTQGAGGSLIVDCKTDDQVNLCLKAGMVEYSKDIADEHYKSQTTWRHELVSHAIWCQEKLGKHYAIHYLLKSKSKEEFTKMMEEGE